MPLYDWECEKCGAIFEEMAPFDEDHIPCPHCVEIDPEVDAGVGVAKKIISISTGFYRPDAPWLETVREVVDKEATDLPTRRFLETPNRQTHREWMKARGIRPYEEGERPIPKDREPDYKKVADKLLKRHKERTTICVR